jgi:hypothetical protein
MLTDKRRNKISAQLKQVYKEEEEIKEEIKKEIDVEIVKL